MTRRAALLACTAPLLAVTREQANAALARLAAALSEGDPYEFFRHIDSAFPERERLRAWIVALTQQAYLTSSVEITDSEGDRVSADWYLEIRSRAASGGSERRRRVLTVRFAGRKVTSIEPADFFAPPAAASQP